MKKRFLVFLFLAIFIFSFVVGYITMTFDIKNGILGGEESRNFWQILSPI